VQLRASGRAGDVGPPVPLSDGCKRLWRRRPAASKRAGSGSATIRARQLPHTEPNGLADVEDLRRQQARWRRHGVIDRVAPVEGRGDLSSVEAVLAPLGRV
jgi:hypothetical protein